MEKTTSKVWEVMTKAQQKMVKNFKKYVSMANKDNMDAFFDDVHFLPLFPLFLASTTYFHGNLCLTIPSFM